MKHEQKTKEQLIEELAAANEQLAKLEAEVANLKQSQAVSFMTQFSVDHTPEGISWVQPDGTFAYANDTFCDIMGYSREEMLALSVFDIDPLMSHETWPAVWQSIREKSPALETKHRAKDGHLIDVEVVFNYLQYEGKEYNCTYVLDITERKRAEEALRAERNILRTLIDNLPDNIYVKDTESRFILNNTAHLHNLGVTSQVEALGKTDLDIFPRDLATQYLADEQRIIQSGQPLINREEMVQDQTTGETLWHLTTKVPLRDSQGQVTGLVGMSRNITAQKQAEAERERLQQQIIEAQQQAIAELSTPVIPIMDRIIVLPLLGSIDSLRARDITRTLLAGITQHRAKIVILDVTGVGLMDTGIVNHLNKTIQAARLKGAQTIVTGMSDAVAEAIVDLGIDWSGIQTLADLQTGLLVALNSLGVKLQLANSK